MADPKTPKIPPQPVPVNELRKDGAHKQGGITTLTDPPVRQTPPQPKPQTPPPKKK